MVNPPLHCALARDRALPFLRQARITLESAAEQCSIDVDDEAMSGLITYALIRLALEQLNDATTLLNQSRGDGVPGQ